MSDPLATPSPIACAFHIESGTTAIEPGQQVGFFVCRMVGGKSVAVSWVEDAADARLIAAAPDLLEAQEDERAGPDFLNWVADRLVRHGDHPDADFVLCLRRRASLARAAIAKVKGGDA